VWDASSRFRRVNVEFDAVVALFAHALPRSAGTSQAADGIRRSPSTPGHTGASTTGRAAASSHRYMLEHTDTAFTIPDPGPPWSRYDATTVVFNSDGPTVATESSLNTGNSAGGDLYWSACNRVRAWALVATDLSHFARVDGRPDGRPVRPTPWRDPLLKRCWPSTWRSALRTVFWTDSTARRSCTS
jgi:hypothetical protein